MKQNKIMVLDSKKLQSAIGWFPHKEQIKVLEAFNTSREIVICAGRRSGKTVLASFLLLRELFLEGKVMAVVCPSYDLVERCFTYLGEWLRIFDKNITIQMRPYPKIELNWQGKKSVCYGLSAESPNQILGRSYDLVVIDEASRIPAIVYNSFIFPALSDKKGKAVFISTPLGKNWFYEKYLSVKQSEDGFAIQFDARDNPHYPKGEWERSKARQPSAVFAQEFEAKFTESAASVFRGVRECVIDECLSSPENGHKYVGGLDLAKMNDFSVLIVVDKSVVPYKVVFFQRWQKLPYTMLKEKVYNVARRYNDAKIVVEVNNIGVAVADELRALGVKVKDFKTYGSTSPDWSKKGSKQTLIEKLSVFLESKMIEIPDNEVLINEIESYGYKMTPSGNIQYGAPRGLHDDTVISLALAVSPLEAKEKRQTSVLRARQNRQLARVGRANRRNVKNRYN